MHGFRTMRPQIGLTLSVGNRGQVWEMVLQHEADVGFGGRPPRDERLEAHGFRDNALVLIAAADDPLVGGPVASDELRGRPWLLREPGSGTRAVNEEFLAAAALEAPTLTVGSNGAIKQAARAGLGISFVSLDAVAAEVEAGLLGAIDVRPGPTLRQWHVIRSRVGPARPIVDEFVEFVTTRAAAALH
jgi:LysR family transcriptional regulator, low CO2-responsive transcriptional regulator